VALKVFDGLDHYSNPNTDLLTRSAGFLQWNVPSASALSAFVTGTDNVGTVLQFAGANLFPGSVRPLRAVWADRNAEMYVGVRIKLPSASGSPNGIASGFWFTFVDTVAGAAQVTLNFDYTNYAIRCYRGDYSGTSLGISANNAWPADAFVFVEFHIKIHASAGIVNVRVNGNDVLNLTGQNTKNTANAWADATDFALQTSVLNGTSYAWMRDVYYCDTATDSGSLPNNTFLGDVGTRTLFATGDSSVAWTPNSGVNNYSRVNEHAMDSDTSYNSSANPGDEDQLNFGPITNTVPLIYGLQVTIAARKDDVGSRVIKTGLKSGGTTSYGANHSVPSSYVYFTDLWVLDPNTSANWTRAAVNALAGIYNLVS